MDIKALKLSFEALFSQIVFEHGYLHYGYWEDEETEKISLKRFGEAQKDYFNQIASLIPPGTQKILDVGSGCGGNAYSLIQKQYRVNCICPSAKLNQIARTKLPPESRIFECTFEEYDDEDSHDLLLFSESFHYIDYRQAFSQIKRYAKNHVIIFDYFRHKDSMTADRLSYRQFCQFFSSHLADEFEIERDKDVTMKIVPTFEVLDKIKNDHIAPFVTQLIYEFKKSHPIYSFLLSPFIKKLAKRCQSKSIRSQTFQEQFDYRLILISRIRRQKQ